MSKREYVKKYLSKGLGTATDTRPISVKLPPDIDKAVRSIPNRSDWLREAIKEKLEREQGLIAS